MTATSGAGLALPTGRMVLDVERCSVTACGAAHAIVGAAFLEAVARWVNQPRRGARDLTIPTRDALRSSLPTHTVLGPEDAINAARAVLVVDPLSLPGQQVECFVVDYSPGPGRVDRLSDHLVGVLLFEPNSPTARAIEHVADLYVIDDLSAFSIHQYRQNH